VPEQDELAWWIDVTAREADAVNRRRSSPSMKATPWSARSGLAKRSWSSPQCRNSAGKRPHLPLVVLLTC
jgi:hypothetical protein